MDSAAADAPGDAGAPTPPPPGGVLWSLTGDIRCGRCCFRP
ncbi:hypothetical protein [Streptomyces fulvorobeus]|uniref:Uncharacterized protein n=1 Tax=Streptomyces fulvorobeus TaxID=284028 RepID=A0A7Y9KYY4_9ACTN|nr:hypothetical protein [Streptomyces fulvorobeus]NYE44005.1 hypothetical protein [Streptomyces fulvorobeus]